MGYWKICLIIIVLLFPAVFVAETSYEGDRPEAGSVEAIRKFTTDPRFISPWVAYVPESTTVPSPAEHIGWVSGATGELINTEQIFSYFRALDAASPRVQVEVAGKTEEGRDILVAVIADEDAIANLDKFKAATAALADPRKTTREQAEEIIKTARPIYYINAALHADETGSSEMAPELAYRLAVSEHPMIQQIRKNVIVMINPVSNPDGRDKMSDWFYRYLKGKTDYANLPRQSPPYWGKYVFVDANRDFHQQTQPEARAVHEIFHEYHPQVVHDLHEAIPLLQTWNGTGPYNPNLDPIVFSEFLEMSFHEVTALTSLGMPGVWTWDFGEGFGHHYLDSVGMNHNAIGRGYETFGNATGETVVRDISNERMTREWYRPMPISGSFLWSMRNNVNYQQTALLAILDWTAKHDKWLLRSFYNKSYNSWNNGKTKPPYGFVIPANQPDPKRVAQMIDVLLKQRIEVVRATNDFRIQEGAFPKGTFIIPSDQPYRNYAVDLLLPQEFPKDAEHEPYDDVSWALPVHYGVQALPSADPSIQKVAHEQLSAMPDVQGNISGTGPHFVLNDQGQESLLAARYRLASFRISIAEEAFNVGNVRYARGSWIIADQAGVADAIGKTADELGLNFTRVTSLPDLRAHESAVPRIGVWVPWADTDSIGWIRYTLDQQKIPYVYLRDEEIRNSELRKNVDVIIYGNVDLDLQGQIHGIPGTYGAMAFTKTEKFPSHGTPAASEDITGGPGWQGLANLQKFVEEGGVLTTLGNGSALMFEGGMSRFVRRTRDSQIHTPGTHLKVSFTKPDHPIAYGYPEEAYVFRFNYPVYDVPAYWHRMAYCTSCLDGPDKADAVVLQWGPKEGDDILVSGGGRNLEQLKGHPAIVVSAAGKGKIIAFNFNPMHRYLNHADHRMLWNVILNWSAL